VFRRLRSSFGRIWANPSSLAAAFGLQGAEVAAFSVLWFTTVGLASSMETTVPVAVYHAAVAVLVPPFYVLTVVSLREEAEAPDVPTTAFRAWKALGAQRLFVVGATVGLACALLSLALTVDTVLVLAGLRGRASVFGELPFAVLPAAVGLGLAYLTAPTAVTYAFELAATGRSEPREAWRDALRFGRASPGAALRGVGFDAVLLTIIIVGLRGLLVVVPADPRPVLLAVMVLALVPLLAVLRAWRASYRLELVTAHAPAPTNADPKPLWTRLPTRPTVRQALAVVLVVALVAGVGAVRVVDIRPHSPAEPTAVDPNDPQAAFATEQELRATRSHELVISEQISNATTGRVSQASSRRFVFDMQGREVYGVLVGDANDPQDRFVHRTYRGQGVRATCFSCSSGGQWNGASAPGIADVKAGGGQLSHSSSYPDPSKNWQVVRQNASHVTFGTEDPASSGFARAYEAGLRPGSYVRATFERRTGWLVSIEYRLRLTGTEDRPAQTAEKQFEVLRTGPDPVQRPEPTGWQGPFELMWDLAYY